MYTQNEFKAVDLCSTMPIFTVSTLSINPDASCHRHFFGELAKLKVNVSY